MRKTADGLILLLNTLCLIENNALLAFKLKLFLQLWIYHLMKHLPLDTYIDWHILTEFGQQQIYNSLY